MRGGDLNVPALLGTLIALAAASVWMSQELAGPLVNETWDRLTFTLVLFGSIATCLFASFLWRFALAIERSGNRNFLMFCLGIVIIVVGMALMVGYPIGLAFLAGWDGPAAPR